MVQMVKRNQILKELSWSEKQLPQSERTKHVHKIHQYVGKFVPQLVDYFLEKNLRNSKIILDPFVGSGTTLVQANIHNIPSIGIDVSEFNVMLSNVKVQEYNTSLLKEEIYDILTRIENLNWKSKSSSKNFTVKSEYLKKWYSREALFFLLSFKKLISRYQNQDVLKIILSRSARSSRLIAHHELVFPTAPQRTDYYCRKHHKICHPTTNVMTFIQQYCKDVLNRIIEFQKLRKNVYTKAFCSGAKNFNFNEHAHKIDGIITSPPYVGLMDYHEQHKYAYELLNFKNNSKEEIGQKKYGRNNKALKKYKLEMTKVFKNIIENAVDHKNGNMVIIVNDRFDLYDEILHDAGIPITKRLKRQVNRRSGRRSSGFYEDIIIWNAKYDKIK